MDCTAFQATSGLEIWIGKFSQLLIKNVSNKKLPDKLPGHNGIGKFSQLIVDKVSNNKLPDEITTPKKGK